MSDFWQHYQENMREERAKLYFDIIKDYFEGYSDFSQVYNRVAADLEVPEDHVATSVSFDEVKTFYGDVDLSRNCAAPLTAYYAQKENDYGNETHSRI
jgi:hypothetical protein